MSETVGVHECDAGYGGDSKGGVAVVDERRSAGSVSEMT